MNDYLKLYLRWMKSLLSKSDCTIQSNIIIFDSLAIFYKNCEEDIKYNLKNKILSENNDVLENTSHFYLSLFQHITGTSNNSIPLNHLSPIEEDTISINSYNNEELENLYTISCNKKEFKSNLKLKDECIYYLEAKMLLEYETGNIEGGNLIFKILNNFGNNNLIMDSAYRKLLSKQNPIGYWGLYSKTKFRPDEIESLLNLGFDSLRTLTEYKNKDFHLY